MGIHDQVSCSMLVRHLGPLVLFFHPYEHNVAPGAADSHLFRNGHGFEQVSH